MHSAKRASMILLRLGSEWYFSRVRLISPFDVDDMDVACTYASSCSLMLMAGALSKTGAYNGECLAIIASSMSPPRCHSR